MTSRKEKRKQSYQFIYHKLQESCLGSSYNMDKTNDYSGIISLAEICNLKIGYADPSVEFTGILKTLLQYIASDNGIEEYLVKLF